MGTWTAWRHPVFNGAMRPKFRDGDKAIRVVLEEVPTAGAQDTLHRAYDLILRSAAQAEEQGLDPQPSGSGPGDQPTPAR